MAGETTSGIAEQHGDRRAVMARLSRDWTVLHETPWPGRRHGVLDHLAIGPTGVYVIVVGDDATRASAAADAVAGLLPGLPREHLHGVLVGADHPAPWVEVDGAILCETVDLVRLLRSRGPVLTREEVAGIVGVVHVGLERADRARSAAEAAGAAGAAGATAAGHAPLDEPAARDGRRDLLRWARRRRAPGRDRS